PSLLYAVIRVSPHRSSSLPYTTLFRSTSTFTVPSGNRNNCSTVATVATVCRLSMLGSSSSALRWATNKISLLPSIASSKALTERSEEHTSELQSRFDLVCRLLLEKKNT